MSKLLTIIISLTVLLSCQSTEWQDFPPKEFQGKFTQVSDGIIQGYENPVIIEISENIFQYNSLEDEVKRTYPILKVSKKGHSIVIFCGDKNENHIANFRYEMFWGKDNYLHISEIVATGYNNEDGEFEVGKFTHNEYTVPNKK